MSKKKPKIYNPIHLIEAIRKWPNPIIDKKHNYAIYLEEEARTNQTRIQHIVRQDHNLKVRDLENVPNGINDYFEYKADPVYKNTFNYYITRKGEDKGFVKVSVEIDNQDKTKARLKTVFVTYEIKQILNSGSLI